ncbi:MAG: ABC transporter ATP-binding protein [Clostridioides sp.]|jgi:ABC-2 type transport system ATP-binding protein|nr:ABC transporter ATP-binding protein [Clostridioides sp.]
MLDIKNFSKSYKKGQKVVDGLNLRIEAGDICAFVGHNGAGKSTAIKAIVGILDFEEGEILIDGHSIKTEPIECKKILSYTPDNPDIYEHMTGIQYLNFIADIFDMGDERNERIKKYADAFEITDKLGNLISSYSHGMKQKLTLISAFMHEPRLMILDEPFVGLDPRAILVLKETMHEFCDKGCAIFFSTHVLEVAEKLCNKVAMIHKGKLALDDTMENLLRRNTLENLFMEVLGHEE